MTHTPMNFSSSDERDGWVKANADYWTVIKGVGLNRVRLEVPTLEEARAAAAKLAAQDPTDKRGVLIYAVAGIYDAYAETVWGEGGKVK